MNNRNLIIAGAVVLLAVVVILAWPGRNTKTIGQGQEAQILSEEDGAQQIVSAATAKELYTQALKLQKDGETLEAKKIYQTLLMEYPEYEEISAVEQELENLNLGLIFSNKPVEGKTIIHEVAVGDTLGKIAKKYGVTIESIQKSNNVKGDIIRVGQKLRIWQGQFNVFIDKSQNILMLRDADEAVKIYRVSTGANNSTPVGDFKIAVKLENPVWFSKEAVIPPDSPKNELGSRWMGFDLEGYGIHGTVHPETIGQQVTAGCVRMVNEEAEELFSLLPVGTPVKIVD